MSVVRRTAWIGGQTVLAHRADGSCVLLTNAGRRRILDEFGGAARGEMPGALWGQNLR